MPRRFTGPMREMLVLQPRFAATKGRRGLKFLEHRRFRAAYDLMVLRAEVGDVNPEIAEFWSEVQTQNAEQRLESFDLAGKPDASGGRRRPRRRRPPRANKP
jgi:poly(A) polymerase